MKIRNFLTVVALSAVPVLGVSAQAVAHDGNHPFENCADAKANAYSNIPSSDTRHYAKKLDRDGDGYGCDKHGTLANDGKLGTGYYADKPEEPVKGDGKDLAETGGNSATPYIAVGGVALLGGGVALALRRKRVN